MTSMACMEWMPRLIPWGRSMEARPACIVVAVGTPAQRTAGWRAASRMLRRSGRTALVFAWP